MGKVLITGSSGFLGSNMIPFIDKECVLQYYLHPPTKCQHETTHCDLLEYDSVLCMMYEHDISTVVHLASVVNGIGYNRKHPSQVLDTVTRIDANVMNAAREAKVTNFIYTGTLASYGYLHDNPLVEEEYLSGEPEEAILGYGCAKRHGYIRLKTLLQEYDFRSHHPILPNLYGFYDNFKSEYKRIIPAFIVKMMNNESLTIFGTGKPVRDFLWACDAAKYVWSLTDVKPPVYLEPTNVSYGHGVRIKELVDMLGCEGKVTCDLSHRDPAIGRVLDNTKIKKTHPEFDISRGWYLDVMIENLKRVKEWAHIVLGVNND